MEKFARFFQKILKGQLPTYYVTCVSDYFMQYAWDPYHWTSIHKLRIQMIKHLATRFALNTQDY